MLPFVCRRVAPALALALTVAVLAPHARAQGAPPPPAAPATSPTAAPSTTPAVDVSSHVWLTLASTGEGGRIEAQQTAPPTSGDDDDRWTKVCDEPCGIWVPPHTKLRVNGDFRESAPFTLPPRPAVSISATPPHGPSKAGAIALTAASGAVLGFTLAFAFLTNVQIEEDHRTPSQKATDRRQTTLLLAGSGVSLGGLVTGLFLLRNINRTTVELHEATATNATGSVRLPLARGVTVSPSGVHF